MTKAIPVQYPGLTVDEYKAIIAVEGLTLTPEQEARLRAYEEELKRGKTATPNRP